MIFLAEKHQSNFFSSAAAAALGHLLNALFLKSFSLHFHQFNRIPSVNISIIAIFYLVKM